MKKAFHLLFDRKGFSHAISAVVISAVIITLVLVASMYAYQVLEQHRAMAEFECAKESILAFNDALENVARTGRDAARSAHFTIEYGYLELSPDAETLNVAAQVDGSNIALYSGLSGLLKYHIENKYVNYGQIPKTYILGDERPLVVNTESFGRAFIEPQSGLVSITLDYRVRAMKTSVIEVSGESADTVDIWIIKVGIGQLSSYIHDFDLRAKCINVETYSTLVDNPPGNSSTQIDVELGGESGSASISLDNPEKILFNVIVTEVLVTV